MKKLILASSFILTTLTSMAQDIQLPAVNTTRTSASMMETLAGRHSVREYSSKDLTLADLGDLCWAACGMTRDTEHRTSPTAMNKKEIRLYVFNAKGVYEYMPVEHQLRHVCNGDQRRLVAGGSGFKQDFVMQAPVSLVMVIDFDRFGQKNERAMMMGCVDAGNVSENINLYCQSVGLCTVPRATMDTEGIRSLLGLGENQLPIMNNTVGYPKE